MLTQQAVLLLLQHGVLPEQIICSLARLGQQTGVTRQAGQRQRRKAVLPLTEKIGYRIFPEASCRRKNKNYQ